MSNRTPDVRRVAAAFSLALLVALMMPFTLGGATAQEAADPGAELGGYTGTASGAPISMLFFEPVFPIPVDPGEPHAEGTLSYTSTRLESGPTGRSVASSIWPGPAFGDGFPSICECDQEWFAKAEARDPGGEQEAEQQIPGINAGMYAKSEGTDLLARADSAGSPNEDGVAFGNVKSRSTSTIDAGAVIAETVASAKGVSLGGGAITIDSVRTKLTASSDGKKATSKGQTTVNGLVIGGYGYVVDSKGLQPVEEEKPGDSVLPLPDPREAPGEEELRKELGIEVELAKHKQTREGADVSRKAGGLRISIDTAVLKKALTDNVPLSEILPDEMEAEMAPLLALAPRIDYVLGRAAVRAAASEAMDLDFDLSGDVPPPIDAGPPPDDGFGDTPLDDTELSSAEPELADPAPAEGEQTVAAPEVATDQAAAQLPAFFGGLPPGLVAAGLALAAVGGRGLAGLTGAAMGGGGAFCDAGAAKRLPDLRSQR